MAAKYTNATPIAANGETHRLDEWASRLGCPVQTIIGRLNRSGNEVEAVTKPVAKAPSNRGTKVAAEILVGDEIDKLLDSARKSKTAVRDRAMIVISYRAGLRCCELLALQAKDVDRSAKTIRILHGKGDKARVVGVDVKAWGILEEWMNERNNMVTLPDAPLFCTRQGGSINPRQVRAMMTRRGKAAGLGKHVHMHGLRHTMASEMAAEGVPLLDICGALGHANASTTNRYLQQLSPTSVLNAMRDRTWGAKPRGAAMTSGLPSPAWLDRLRGDIGDRLMLFHDARQDEDAFRAVVLLF